MAALAQMRNGPTCFLYASSLDSGLLEACESSVKRCVNGYTAVIDNFCVTAAHTIAFGMVQCTALRVFTSAESPIETVVCCFSASTAGRRAPCRLQTVWVKHVRCRALP